MVSGSVASGGGVALLLSSVLSGMRNAPPTVPVPSANLSRFLNEWSTDAAVGRELPVEEDDCAVYNGSAFDESGCSMLAVSRVSSGAVRRAQQRALACAALMETDCMLGEEVGLRLPVAFVYSASSGLRALLAPKPRREEGLDPARVRLLHPRSGEQVGGTVQFNRSVVVEFLERAPAGVQVLTERFNGTAAYCVQMLRLAYSDECWAALD